MERSRSSLWSAGWPALLWTGSAHAIIALLAAAAPAGVPTPQRLLVAAAVFFAGYGITLLILLLRNQRESRLSISAQRIASGDLRHRATLEVSGSARELADAINQLATQAAARESRLISLQYELKAILQSMDGGVLLLDMQQRVLSLNRAAEWMLGLSESQGRGRLLQEIARQPDLNRFVAEALAGIADETEFALIGPQIRRVRATHTTMQDAEGKQVGLLIVLNDITQLRRLESVRSDFASNVSHELRTPITNIKGYVETLIDMDLTEDREQNARFLQIIAKNADRLGAIVEDMLMLTQLERPDTDVTLEKERTRIAMIVDAALLGLEAESAAKSITLISEVPEDLFADVNNQLIEQAISNLVMNAIRYSPVTTRVWIRAAQKLDDDGRSRIEIEVVDEGPGIAEEHLMRIFERFYRVDKARSREQGGTGLGLAIVKHILHLHGGRVEVKSALGKGSTFCLILPVN